MANGRAVTFSEADELELLELELELEQQDLQKTDPALGPQETRPLQAPRKQFRSVFAGIPDERTSLQRLRQAGVGASDAATTLGSGMFFGIAAGLGGLETVIESSIRGEEDPLGDSIARIEEIASKTFPLTTPEGEALLAPVHFLADLIRRGGKLTGNAFESAAIALNNLDTVIQADPAIAGATGQTSFETGLSLLGMGRVKSARVRKDITAIEKVFKENGIDINAPIEKQLAQTREAGLSIAGVVEKPRVGGEIFPDAPAFKGRDLEVVVSALQKAKIRSGLVRDGLFKEARNADTGIRVRDAIEFPDIAREALDDYILFDSTGKVLMPKAVTLLNELDVMAARFSESPPNTAIKLNSIARFRQRINKNISKKADTPEDAALIQLKGELDNFMQSKFAADLITGNPEGIALWKNANLSHQRHKETFDNDKIIKKLIKEDVSAEGLSNIITGSSDSGFKVLSADIVKSIKNIIGEDSVGMIAIRNEAALKLIAPLLERDITPTNLKEFVNNFDRTYLKNNDLIKELFPDSGSQLKNLVGIARAQSKSAISEVGLIKLTRATAVYLFGSGLARKALLVRSAEKGLDFIRSQSGFSEKRLMMADIVGYDPLRPPLGVTEIGKAALLQQREQEDPLGENFGMAL